ncbi:MAG: tRNA (adenosine(37)-N6)-threonylcarbamoyltransferase complex ATPase subunit type 1 TsaE [Clostridia bacterium]|nr:tRNA (adenosine(37)-N6)-threonylcarbamoyltransferase complex ATPase subunit type 1 TsaE [Clostridia bacterium]
MEYITNDVLQTEKLGTELAQSLPGGPVFVALYGDLGAGKTAFVRGFTSVLSPGSRVKSPTYTIVNEYRKGKRPVYHFDLYRIESEDDLDAIGFDEYVQNGICIAEWCEHIGTLLPDHAITVKIEKTGENGRKITICNEGE